MPQETKTHDFAVESLLELTDGDVSLQAGHDANGPHMRLLDGHGEVVIFWLFGTGEIHDFVKAAQSLEAQLPHLARAWEAMAREEINATIDAMQVTAGEAAQP